MKVSYFETGRYVPPPDLPREWPVPPGAYDPETGAAALRGMVERVNFVEKLGFDWVSLSEHHYSPRILTPSPVVSATWLAARVDKIKIALLGPIVPVSNPIRVAEELAMLDTLAPGRIVVGLLRGTTNEYLSYDLNPKEARERTDEGMELILKAWTEPQPFGWQGRHFQYRTVSIWPRPQAAASADLCARHQRRGGRVRRAPPPRARRLLRHVRADGEGDAATIASRCAEYGWEPGPDDIIYRANMILGETDEAAEEALRRRDKQAPFPVRAGAARCAARRR